MKQLTFFFVLISFFISFQIYAQTFPRTFEIKDPSGLELAFGNIIAGVDFDQDGFPEIYAVNANINDRPYELIARIYKFEWNPITAAWDSVWGAVADIPQQNTYPALAWGDTDKDGKPEIYWGPSNFLDPVINRNPYRILVYEYPGDGSDNMGVYDSFIEGFLPNAKTKIINQEMINIAPIKFMIEDPDGDGRDEIIFSNQAASSSGFHLGIISVDNIPDLGDETETWTLEYDGGTNDPNLIGTNNKWDFIVVGNLIGLMDSNGRTNLLKYEGSQWISYPYQTTVAGYESSWLGMVKTNLSEDQVGVYLGNWFTGKIYIVEKPDEVDTLVSHEVADFAPYANRLMGSGVGDIDGDMKPDMIFGSRYMTTNTAKVPILRLEFQGGDEISPLSYEMSIIDSAYWDKLGDMSVICVANVDGDPEDEVLYTQGYPRGNTELPSMPIIVLDLQFTPVSVEKENDIVPTQFYLDQNFPNPFNPTTEIKFGITESANIDLRIYDALGREVAILINNEFMSAGSYNVKYNASNLASGNYIYRMTSGANTVSRKMQLLK